MMAQSFARILARIARDQRGTSFIELAFLMPVLLLLLLGSVDMSRMISARMDLEQAAQRTTDFALSSRPNGSDTSYLVAEAVAASGLTADDVTVELFLECNGEKQANFDAGCPGGNIRSRYVTVSIQDSVDPMFDWSAIGALVGTSAFDSAFTVTGDSTVRFQ